VKKTNSFTMSPLQCRVLSILSTVGVDGISCTEIARTTKINRAVLYVLVRRLAAKKWVRRRSTRVPGRNEHHVLYAITGAGQQARVRYARELFLHY
jgi:DNA-binding MarR family transcriptional regulator